MIWKVFSVLSVTLCVLGHQAAISEQRVTIHFQKSGSGKSSPLVDSIKPNPQDQISRENPSYEFSYKVNDPETHDIKGQHEIKEGDEVTGNYWLIEPNGKKRTVNYQANDDKGFNAQIEYAAFLQSEQDGKNIEISQNKNVGENDNQKNNDEGIEYNVTEIIDDVEEANIGNNNNESDNDEMNEENQVDNEKDRTENISNALNSNIDRTDRRNRDPSNQKTMSHNGYTNTRVLNKSRRKNRTDNSLDKGKREKKRNKTHDSFPSGIVDVNNVSNHDVYPNSNQEVIKSKENSTKRTHQKQGKHINLPQNSKSSNQSIGNNLPITTSQEQNNNAEREVSKKANINDNEQNSKVYSSDAKVRPNIDRSDMPDSEIYEHRIRILHSKFIPSNAKDGQT